MTVSDFPTGTVYINGTVTINSTFSETETSFKMGPEAKIVINAPNTFTATGKTNFTAGCNYMWDGIYVNGTTSKIVLNGINPVSDAMNAINSTNGGNYEVKNSGFSDNFIGIKVTDYRPSTAINHPGIVYETTFRNEHNMIAPYTGQKTYTGIYVENVYNLTIGNVANLPNVFDNVFCGIQSYNSYMTVVKNTFKNIQRTPMCTPGEVTDYSALYCETAIHVAKKVIPNYPNFLNPIVTIGGATTAEENIFTTCDLAYNSYLAKQTIRNNTVNTSKTGFYCRDVIYGSVISNNNFTANTTNIYINSTIPSNRGITIENNTLNNIGTYGIRIFNCKSLGLVKTKVLNNTIYFTGPKVSRGIHVANSDAITLQGNVITNSGALVTTTALSKFMRGISIENSPNSLVKSNTFTKMGSGIYAEGMESGTQFQCNELSQNYYGFYFPNGLTVGTVYENQGTATTPNDNKWISDHPYATAYRISGDATPNILQKTWYYRAGTNSYYPNVLIGNPAYFFATMSQLPSTAPSPCGSKGGDNDNTTNSDSTSSMETIIPDNANLAVQMRYTYMSMLYNSNAKQFAAEITQDEQSLYQNIPLIAKINDLSQNDTTIDRAIALNNTLAPVNEMETYRKFVNEIYLNFVIKGGQPSAELIDELYSIADMAPNIGGEAVYIARAILNYEPTKLNKQNIILPFKISTDENIQFYPNPANDVLNISSTESFVMGSKIELYDITGRMIFSSTINIELNSTSISLKDIKQGLYLCIIKNGEKIVSSSKISVVK